jgi:hypothetical protein
MPSEEQDISGHQSHQTGDPIPESADAVIIDASMGQGTLYDPITQRLS